MIALTTWQQKLCIAVSRRTLDKVASDLAFYYESLSWWQWVRRLRVRHQLRIVTVALDAYRMGWLDGGMFREKKWR